MSSALAIAILTFGSVATGVLALRAVVRGIRGGLAPEVEARLRELEAPPGALRNPVAIGVAGGVGVLLGVVARLPGGAALAAGVLTAGLPLLWLRHLRHRRYGR